MKCCLAVLFVLCAFTVKAMSLEAEYRSSYAEVRDEKVVCYFTDTTSYMVVTGGVLRGIGQM